MKTKTFIFISLALIISVFINIVLGFNLSSKSQENQEYSFTNKKLKEENKSLKEELQKKEGIIINEQLAEDKNAKKVVKDFFKTQYEYNSDSYKEKFKKIKPYVSNKVYGQLTAAGIPDIPNVKFENKIENLKLFLTSENQELTGLVLLDTVYTVDGVKSPKTTQIFQVTVAKQDGQQKITSLEILGTFSTMTES